MGRVCYHPCETACNRAELDEAVGINSVERFLGDLAIDQGWSLPGRRGPTGRRVLVVGRGPAGPSAPPTTCAGSGTRSASSTRPPTPGGMMRFGIPAYRLPRDVLDAEIDRIVALGVELELDRTVHDIEPSVPTGASTPSFLAVGAQLASGSTSPRGTRHGSSTPSRSSTRSPRASLPGSGAGWSSTGAATPPSTPPARPVASAPPNRGRLPAHRERMPAHGDELDEALDEGVTVRWLSTVDRLRPAASSCSRR